MRWTVWSLILCVIAVTGLANFSWAQFETRGAYAAPYFPRALAVGDFNGDGILDLAAAVEDSATGYSTEIQVLLGNGDGTFRSAVAYTVGEAPDSVQTADINHDGKLDIVTASAMTDTLSVLLGNGDGTFQPALTLPSLPDPTYLALADFNHDGNIDIATLNLADSTGTCLCVAIMLGNGDGTFQDTPIITSLPVGPFGMGIGSFNGDGKLDIAVAEEFGGESKIQILLGNGDGTFKFGTSYEVGAGPRAVVVADFNGDHKADLAVAESGGIGVGVLLGNGNGTFRPRVDYPANSPLWITAADLNGDGKIDIVGADIDFPPAVAVLMGNGDGTFQKVKNYLDGSEDEFVSVADFNGDQRPDIVVLDTYESNSIVLLNTGAATFSPNTPLNFKNQKVGTTSPPQTVTFTNTGTAEIKIASMVASSQFHAASKCGTGVAAGTSCAISITFSPSSRGAKSGLLTIRDSASSKPEVIELMGSGT
jgi:hypothetical protein